MLTREALYRPTARVALLSVTTSQETTTQRSKYCSSSSKDPLLIYASTTAKPDGRAVALSLRSVEETRSGS